MSLVAYHECTRVPVTALATFGPFLLAAEGPYLRIYHGQTFELIATRKIFESQAIHGISVASGDSQCTLVAIWGGYLVRALKIQDRNLSKGIGQFMPDQIELSSPLRVSDWILDLCFGPHAHPDISISVPTRCAAITAHDALLELNISLEDDILCISSNELTSSTRSILYSAHVSWASFNHILVAAGTAFGEIIYWSWKRNPNGKPNTQIHCIFLGHEGSIFGVHISQEIEDSSTGRKKRLLASCSDDRTIRIWDALEGDIDSEEDSELKRTRHTGFSDNEFENQHHSTSKCLAIGWGHTSRVWTVRFMASSNADKATYLLSSGEDATSRLWHLRPRTTQTLKKDAWLYDLQLINTTAYHEGKNIWSTVLYNPSSKLQHVFCGAADSKIVGRPIPAFVLRSDQRTIAQSEYSLQDITNQEKQTNNVLPPMQVSHKSSKKSEFFRSYAFIDATSFLLTTNTGKIYVESLQMEEKLELGGIIKATTLVKELEDLSGYSICVGEGSLGVVFIGSARGIVFAYQTSTGDISSIAKLEGKVGSMFVSKMSDHNLVLTITLMGRKTARLLYLTVASSESVRVVRSIDIPIPELSTGLTITSTAFVSNMFVEEDHIFLGFRGGAIAAYSIPKEKEEGEAFSLNVTTNVHGKEAVTSLLWESSGDKDSNDGRLISVGRDSHIAIYSVDIKRNLFTIVHNLPLPIGPNLEGLYYHNGRLFIYGFSSTSFVSYDITTEEEIMSIESGGSHRSWAFQPHHKENGGTLVWTRASSMHVHSQARSNHNVVRSGGHGREIKAIAISNPQGDAQDSRRQLIATGAEDTDIKIFEYIDGDLICRRTLRKHTTGIQHLQWSGDRDYLFSSGGCEEFYIWRVRELSSPGIDIGVVCESVCAPESEHSDLRIMSFDVQQHSSPVPHFVIAMVYSDSTIRIYTYTLNSTSWQTIAKGTYFTSCLTQCTFISPTTLLTAGTDGHAVLWSLPATSTPFPTTLAWRTPIKIHQNASKTLELHTRSDGIEFIVSGGDDGSLSFIITTSLVDDSSIAYPPLILKRAHASAVTSTAVVTHDNRTFIITSGNDQWVRVWELLISPSESALDIKRVTKVKTSVADVSSMAILHRSEAVTKVAICGVGMEIIRLEHGL
ncbi:WD40-repeat-containing domain protein [Dendryphion nanum]|uniref:WD40-repeat-containing domain protein n=1 Tax=Dendryphion nanum TaxID=256645 RepID=A0A9P9INE3_9PLEO|nr:WD40-repeat-containing domain protein [Dendryphion nanum]